MTCTINIIISLLGLHFVYIPAFRKNVKLQYLPEPNSVTLKMNVSSPQIYTNETPHSIIQLPFVCDIREDKVMRNVRIPPHPSAVLKSKFFHLHFCRTVLKVVSVNIVYEQASVVSKYSKVLACYTVWTGK